MLKPMELAVKKAYQTMSKNIGGPFGAVIVDANGNIVSVCSNRVLKDKDPTAHAEITAIRKACKKLGTYDLSGCTIYTTAYPCPMCLGAIIWANIKTCYYGCRASDAEEIGFRDDFIYRFIKGDCKEVNVLELTEHNRNLCIELFKDYSEKGKVIY